MTPQKPPSSSAVPGLAIIGLLMTGVLGCVHSFLFASGIGLIAAAIAFGTLLFVSFR